MRRFYQHDEIGLRDHLALSWQTVFHEAGHVAAIYLENKRKGLPPIDFEIHVSKQDNMAPPFFAKVSGGRLIGDLTAVTQENVALYRNSSDIDSYRRVYEADVINFLAGPLAEAKYVLTRDNEIFNINLLTPQALNHYGGNADLVEVMSYLEFFIPSPEQREAKLNALFAETFNFILQPSNWKSITALAHHILSNADKNISCVQAIEVLETSIKNSQHAPNLQAAFLQKPSMTGPLYGLV
ncbi:MAG: hypothetical protein ACXVB6_12300 [Mucilaginibacter sp.]